METYCLLVHAVFTMSMETMETQQFKLCPHKKKNIPHGNS